MKLEHICQQCLTQPWIHLLVFRAHLLFAVVTRLLWELQIVIYCWEFIEWSFKYLNLPCVPIKLCNKMFNPLRTLNYFLMFLYSVTNCKLCILCDAKYVFKQLKKVSCVQKKKKNDKGNCVCWPCYYLCLPPSPAYYSSNILVFYQ